MSTEHTPGPWKCVDTRDEQNNPCGYSVWEDYEPKYVNDRFGREICQTPDGTTKENLANAHLIAAAPDLLKELKESTNVLKIITGFLKCFSVR